ncbi:Selenoprotein, Rdx type [Corchorus capsularis]|uniref:Selenoprotein, Rdx type n=1 Tax=Corchorus capsularis TaxID=210143 RepID=A0A1R3IU36_COCAP|nr:Selenoprotein, Rdx type [Corchorus capsularis]
MAPKKRKTTDGGEEEQAKPQADATFRRVTRSMSKQGGSSSSGPAQPVKKPKAPRGKAKATAKEETESAAKVEEADAAVAEEEGLKEDAVAEDEAVAGEGANNKTVIVEHCTSCREFKTRASQVKDGLEEGVPGITVLLNPVKPRKGCFEVREEGGETFISLLDMKRPFNPMKALDLDDEISKIIEKIK